MHKNHENMSFTISSVNSEHKINILLELELENDLLL